MEKISTDDLLIFVNGVKIEHSNVDPDWTLLRYLREKLLLPGTKLGCSEGGCGACTVMVSRLNLDTLKPEHFAVNACLAPVCSMHGLAVTTVEGIGSTRSRLHPVQERLAKAHGSQCGFCTPGFVMSMYTLLRNSPQPSMEQIEESLIGNLCRCTGYRPILEGFRTFSSESIASAVNGCGKKDCCLIKEKIENGLDIEHTEVLFNPNLFLPYDPSQEIIFPPELKAMYKNVISKSVIFRGPRTTFYRPTTLEEVIQLKASHPKAKIIVGNTEVGIEVKYKNQEYPIIINPLNIPELLEVHYHKDSEIEIGAAVTISKIEEFLRDLLRELSKSKSPIVKSLLEMTKWFAGQQIKNVAAMGGNIMTSSPISDLNPVLVANGATLKFRSVDGDRQVAMDDKFFTSYRRNLAKPNEVLVSVKIPLTLEDEYAMAYKQSRRKDDDIAIVNAAMRVKFGPRSLVVQSVSLIFGGMAATTVVAKNTMKAMVGLEWNEELLELVLCQITKELELSPSAPGGMVEYRQTLAASFFFKFYISVKNEVAEKYPNLFSLKEEEKEHLNLSESGPVKSTQFFQNVPVGQSKIDPVGRPVVHRTSFQQTTGEATYIDDLTPCMDELYAGFVTSTRCHAIIINVDATEALQMKGVEGFFSAKDLTDDRNKIGLISSDEEIFASTEVKCTGQLIGIVVADDPELARRAARKVIIEYEDLPNPILTIKDAIEAKSFWKPLSITNGNIEDGFRNSDRILEGESYIGGQEHFYLETNVAIAVPHEDGEMTIISSTQSPTMIQNFAAKALGIPENKVVCKVKRMGGAFGGKESRNLTVAVPLAIAASRLNRPVRAMLDRIEDMEMTGTRHPFFAKWKIGLKNDGKIEAVEMELYSNAGYSLDYSPPVLQRALLHCENAYRIENMKVVGYCCRTNIPTCTAFRGFGGPQGIFVCEDMMTKAAEFLKIDYKIFREKNFYADNGDSTHYGQELIDCKISACWNQVVNQSNYEQRLSDVSVFNSKHRFKKRGMSLLPAKFAIAFTAAFLNQAGALVHIYLDGSVLVTHSGTEMGQGLHTKMIQVTSRALGIPLEKILISETSTDKVPNTSPTAASSGSDLNGMAIIDACNKLLNRLLVYKKENPEGKWEDWVTSAYFDRVSLSATGFYRTPDITQYNFETGDGRPFDYFCYGAAATEVEIDCLTGDHKVLRTDIVMDVGNSLNPAIDIGQIEGAFIQGQGLFTIEELRYSPEGVLLTKGPGSYKIPSIQDIPKEFNVCLLRNSSNPRAVYSSKAVGEPPLILAATVFFAIRDAINAARAPSATPLHLISPATSERIRMACEDQITEKITKHAEGSYKPWSVFI